MNFIGYIRDTYNRSAQQVQQDTQRREAYCTSGVILYATGTIFTIYAIGMMIFSAYYGMGLLMKGMAYAFIANDITEFGKGLMETGSSISRRASAIAGSLLIDSSFGWIGDMDYASKNTYLIRAVLRIFCGTVFYYKLTQK